jgi:carbonic anhydrase
MKSALRLTANAVIIFLLAYSAAFSDDHATKSKHANLNVLHTLLDGNKRFVEGTATHPHQDRKTLMENSKGQNPFAVIIGCSDSRVPVETLFDVGLGDIFVIRNAGNLISKYELGSIQYAAEHLGVKFIGIMGHTDCGAVKAYAHGHVGEGNIKDIVQHISDEEEEQEIPEPKHEHLNRCIFANIFHGYKQIINDPLIQKISKEHGEIIILPLIYDVETGLVQVLDPNLKSPH